VVIHAGEEVVVLTGNNNNCSGHPLKKNGETCSYFRPWEDKGQSCEFIVEQQLVSHTI